MAQPLKAKTKQPLIVISDPFYDFLKAFIMVIAPSAIALYLGISAIFDFPGEVYVEISLVIATVIVGFFLYFSSKSHKHSDLKCDGDLYVTIGESGELLYSLELNDEPDTLRFKSHITFRVINKIDNQDSPEVVD